MPTTLGMPNTLTSKQTGRRDEVPQIGSLATVAYGRSGEPILVGLVGVVGLVPAIVSVAWGTAAAGIGSWQRQLAAAGRSIRGV